MHLLATLIGSAGIGYVNTNAGRKVYVCAEPQPSALTQAQYEALTWVPVGGVGSHGETGSTTNILNYDTWDDEVTDKTKGMTNAGDPDLEVAYRPEDDGQIVLRAAADTNFKYAFKIEGNDRPNNDPDSTPTVRYNRGLVTGPRQPNGRNEDFQIDIFSLALVQKQITVPAVDGTTIP